MAKITIIALSIALGLIQNQTLGQEVENPSYFKVTSDVKKALNIGPTEKAPKMYRDSITTKQVKQVPTVKKVTWKSDCFHFRDLVFEEPNFERRGDCRSEAQQFVNSAYRFFSKAAIQPGKRVLGGVFKR